MTLFLDALFRFSAVGLLLMLAIFALRDQRDSWPGRLIILLCISLVALLIGVSPRGLGLSNDAAFIFRLIDVPNTVLAWLFIKSLIDDDFKMNWLHWSIAALWCVPLWIIRFDMQGYYDLVTSAHIAALNIFGAGLFIYLIYFILKGRKDDLVEPRRRLRLIFVFTMIGVALISIGSEFIFSLDGSLPFFKAALILAMLIAAYLWMLQMRPDYLGFYESVAESEGGIVPALIGKDAALHKKLYSEMEDVKAWLEPSLTITQLAGRLAVTEHTLRALINQRLGFRNFNAFLNSYRIEAVKAAFQAPETSDLPILTIALDAGFNSLPPFNRAFKKTEGMTPKAYRQSLR